MASIDKLRPNDPRVTHKNTTLNGRKYHYILSVPKGGQIKATVFLIHGWPDLSFAWRYQIPFLTSLGLRVVAPDMMGYGGTDAPQVPPESMHLYGLKRAADDIAALAKEVGVDRIILGGHDWGGLIVYRAAQWYPELVTHVFSVCTPFIPTSSELMTTSDLVNSLPQFGYQLQLASPDLESALKTPEHYQRFFKGIFGGRTESGQVFLRPETGVDLPLLDEPVGDSPLVSNEEIEFYVQQFTRNGMHGPCNWYRNREANFEDEKKLSLRTVDQPTLFILATKDNILTRDLTSGMEAYLSGLTRREVEASHWALWQKPSEVNQHVKEWLESVVFGKKSTL